MASWCRLAALLGLVAAVCLPAAGLPSCDDRPDPGCGPANAGVSADEDGQAEGKSFSLLQLASDAASKRRRRDGAVLQHPWPHPRGPIPDQHGTTTLVGPENLTAALAWSWSHPKGRFYTTVAGGPVIDRDLNIYLVTNDGLRKFSAGGDTLWHYRPPGDMNNAPCLLDGAVFGNTDSGYAFALDLRTGVPIWIHRYANDTGLDSGYPAAFAGRYIFGVDMGHDKVMDGGNTRVLAVNATDGSKLWEFHPDRPVWNLMPVFPDNTSVLFMDYSGGAYKLGLADGTPLWHAPVDPASAGSFTDGGLMLGPNGLAYTCSNRGRGAGHEGTAGAVRALSVASGAEVWSQVLPMPCNSWAAVGDIGAGSPSVVLTLGSFPELPGTRDPPPHHGGMMALDAGTGQLQWHFQPATYLRPAAAGDAENFFRRLLYDAKHALCLPGPWSAPTIAGDGTVYAGYMDGFLYAVHGPPKAHLLSSREIPHLLELSTTSRVTSQRFETGAGFLHGGTAWAPGMMVVASCDSLFVFRL